MTSTAIFQPGSNAPKGSAEDLGWRRRPDVAAGTGDGARPIAARASLVAGVPPTPLSAEAPVCPRKRRHLEMRQSLLAAWALVVVLFGGIAFASALPGREPSLPSGVQIPQSAGRIVVSDPFCAEGPEFVSENAC
jgi:hypothetical protein